MPCDYDLNSFLPHKSREKQRDLTGFFLTTPGNQAHFVHLKKSP